MSNCTIDTIKERVKSATPASPIAVFECGKSGFLNAVYADTVESRRWLKKGKDYYGYKYIDTWHQYDNMDLMVQKLRKHLDEY